MNYSQHRSPDRIMRNLLFIRAPLAPQSTEQSQKTAENVLSLSLLFSGVRCVLQYAVLPFVLPFVGVAAEVTTPVFTLLTLLAIVSIFFSLRRFWQINYAYRWQYLVVASAALTLLIAFILLDMDMITL